MSDRVLLPFGDRWIALTPEQLAAALAAGAEAVPDTRVQAEPGAPSGVPLLTAEQICARTGVEASWFLERARRDEIPHVRLGKYVRFDPAAVEQHFARG